MVKDNKKKDLPAMPFYVGDWLKCPEVRALSPDYRGLWFDMLCYMWESTERGVMINPNGKPYTDSEIIRMVGLDNQNSGNWLTILLENGVCKRREDGAIFSKRMVKDEEIRKIRKESGSKGGNPKLLDNQIDNQEVNQLSESENKIVIDYEFIIELYKNLCPKMSKVEKLNEQRKGFLNARYAEYGLDKITEVFRKAGESNFLNGNNDRLWKADFEWIVRPTNFLKILEGKYDNHEIKKETEEERKQRILKAVEDYGR